MDDTVKKAVIIRQQNIKNLLLVQAATQAVIGTKEIRESIIQQSAARQAKANRLKLEKKNRKRIRYDGQTWIRFQFDINKWSTVKCVRETRFTKAEILDLVQQLDVNAEELARECKRKVDAVEALAILLARIAVPRRLVDLNPVFGRNDTEICSISLGMATLLYNKFGHLLRLGCYEIPEERLEKLRRIGRKCQPYYKNLGFLMDGTLTEICNPGEKMFFNGHHGFYSLKYQFIVGLDRLVYSLEGPEVGSMHDSSHYHNVDVISRFKRSAPGMTIYADAAYREDGVVLKPFTKGMVRSLKRNHPELDATEVEKRLGDHNTLMSGVRVAVENKFAYNNRDWSFFKFAPKNKINLSPVKYTYAMSVFFSNIKVVQSLPDLTVPEYLKWKKIGKPSDSDYTRLYYNR